MKKGWSIVLLSIVSLIMAFLMVMTFARFPVGAANSTKSFLGAIELDHGMSESAVYTLTLDKTSKVPDDMGEILDTLSYRLKALGYENHSLKAVKNLDSNVYDVRLEVNPEINEYNKNDITSMSNIVDNVIKYGELKFYGGSTSNPTTELFTDIEGTIATAKYNGYHENAHAYVCTITFSEQAYAVIKEQMSAGSFYLKVMLGEDTLSPFDGTSAMTEGDSFYNKSISITSQDENAGKIMALQINSGGLAYKFDYEKVGVISTSLGNNVPTVSLIVVGALVVVAMAALIVVGKGYGIASALSLLLFALIEGLMMIAVPGIKLSIGGVIGIILSTILAIDGMIMTGKRIKEEFVSGKTYKSALRTGYKRALLPTINVSVVSVIISLLLLAFNSADVKLFAITFGIGSVVALIATLLFTRMFVNLFLPLVKDKEKFLNLKREEA